MTSPVPRCPVSCAPGVVRPSPCCPAVCARGVVPLASRRPAPCTPRCPDCRVFGVLLPAPWRPATGVHGDCVGWLSGSPGSGFSGILTSRAVVSSGWRVASGSLGSGFPLSGSRSGFLAARCPVWLFGLFFGSVSRSSGLLPCWSGTVPGFVPGATLPGSSGLLSGRSGPVSSSSFGWLPGSSALPSDWSGAVSGLSSGCLVDPSWPRAGI